MQPLVKRALLRLLLAGLAGGLSFAPGLARGQTGDAIARDVTVRVPLQMSENPATAPEPEEGLDAAETSSEPSTANAGTVNAVTRECVNGPGSETRLGLLRNSAAYEHCAP